MIPVSVGCSRFGQAVKGFGNRTLCALSAGTIIGSLNGGGLIDMAGIPGMLSVAVICGAVGTYIVLHMTRRAKE